MRYADLDEFALMGQSDLSVLVVEQQIDVIEEQDVDGPLGGGCWDYVCSADLVHLDQIGTGFNLESIVQGLEVEGGERTTDAKVAGTKQVVMLFSAEEVGD